MTEPATPLAGIRVLDLTRQFPGPLATMMLGDLGADVVKIEQPPGGDMMRHLPPLVEGIGAGFLALNRSKRSLAVDLKHPRGRGLFLDLAAGADLVVEGFRPGVIDRLGIGYQELRARRPDVILCSISGYGQDGPDRERAGHDIDYCARTGVLGATGDRGAPPTMPGVQVGDVAGGTWQAMAAVFAALYHRARTGRGQWLDVSMTDGVLTTTLLALQEPLAGGEMPPRGEAPLTGGLPGYGVFETADGRHLAVGALEPHFFDALCQAVGRSDLQGQGMSLGEQARGVRAELADALRQRTRDEWMEVFSGVDACVEPVREGREVFDDPQLTARGMFFSMQHPQAGTIRQVATPLRLEGSQTPTLPPPPLGGHTVEILSGLGLSPDEIEELAADHIVQIATAD